MQCSSAWAVGKITGSQKSFFKKLDEEETGLSVARRDLLVELTASAALACLSGPTWASDASLLKVGGRIRGSLPQVGVSFDMAALEALPQTTLVTQTPWYGEARRFTGPLLKDVLQACGAKGEQLKLIALNDFRADMPMSDVTRYPVVVARLLDGKPMAVRDKGPLFVMYPFSAHAELRTAIYYSRAVWQLSAIEVL